MNIIEKIKVYIIEVRGEIKKVSWPTKKKSIKDSVIVIGVSLATAVFLGSVDYALSEINRIIIG